MVLTAAKGFMFRLSKEDARRKARAYQELAEKASEEDRVRLLELSNQVLEETEMYRNEQPWNMRGSL
jgi:hypothetical protein